MRGAADGGLAAHQVAAEGHGGGAQLLQPLQHVPVRLEEGRGLHHGEAGSSQVGEELLVAVGLDVQPDAVPVGRPLLRHPGHHPEEHVAAVLGEEAGEGAALQALGGGRAGAGQETGQVDGAGQRGGHGVELHPPVEAERRPVAVGAAEGERRRDAVPQRLEEILPQQSEVQVQVGCGTLVRPAARVGAQPALRLPKKLLGRGDHRHLAEVVPPGAGGAVAVGESRVHPTPGVV